MFKNNKLALAVFLAASGMSLSGCGGGGSSSNTDTTNPPPTTSEPTWTAGVFEPSSEFKDQLEIINRYESSSSEITKTLIKMKNKFEVLEDRAFYTDSVYFEIINDLVKIDSKIEKLSPRNSKFTGEISTLILRDFASAEESPTVFPSLIVPLRLIAPVVNNRFSSKVVLPLE